jgi:DNA-binding protein YbaB
VPLDRGRAAWGGGQGEWMSQSADQDGNARLRARFEDVYAQYDRMRSGMAGLQESLLTLEVAATSADGTVTAVVGARGQLTRLTLHEQAYTRHRPEQLARLVTQTVAQAGAAATGEAERMVRRFVPEDSAAGSFLRSTDFTALMRRHDERMGWVAAKADPAARDATGEAAGGSR